METKIDENQYSRQLATFGAESMGKLVKLKVFLHGLRGLGVEIAKNLILAGPNSVVLHDDAVTSIQDLGANFYLTEQDVGNKSRAEASLSNLQELNAYVKVSVHKGDIDTNFLSQFDVVVFTDLYDKSKLVEFGDFCHSKSIGFILADTLGLYGYTFVDFGEKFKCFDINGEENRNAIVTMISKDEQGIVTVHEDKRHGFEDGQTVTFREVQGMSEVNGKQFQIKVLNPLSFSIGDTSSFGEYKREGIVEQVKVPIEFQFKPFSKSLEQPYAPGRSELDNCDFEKFFRPELLHLTYCSLLAFYESHQRLPQLNNEADAAKLVELVKERNKSSMEIEGGIKLDEIDESIVKNVAYFAGAHLSPICAFFGGIVAQEIIKFTGKYTPLRQWLHYEAFEALPDQPVNRQPLNSRYDHQIAVFGQEIQQKFADQKIFLVGAGALGCEYLKQLALMGISCGEKGKVFCTDDDQIEMSNLNRQFLFRKDDVGKSKSEQACKAISKMNPRFNHQSLKLRVSPDNEEYFNDDFFESLSFVLNAVDNVQARLFVDSRCVFYQLPLLESGTLGTKCNSQVILPKITQSYGDSQDPPEESIPLCTLKNFPHQIEHTIQWARDYFQGIFSEGPNEAAAFLQNPQYVLKKMSQEYKDKAPTLRAKFENLQKLAEKFMNPSYDSCVELARLMFEDIHNNMIAQLLHNFPLDHKTSEGLPFWSGPKRPPQVLEFNAEDPQMLQFIQSAANIFAYIFGIPQEHNLSVIQKSANSIMVPKFVPKSAVIQESDKQQVQEKSEDDEQVVERLFQELSKFQPFTERKLNQVEFEKDDDTNFHIDFISACANLRARNYKIPEVDRFKVKLIAGKIIPAIATTTAMVVGAVGIEIYKLVQNKDVSKMKNSFMNLALPLWLFSEPLPAIQQKDKDYDPILLGPVKAIPSGFTTWDKITVKGPLTVKQLIEFIKNEYGVNISIMSTGKLNIYNAYAGKSNADRLNMDLLEVYKHISNQDYPKHKKYLEVEVAGDTEDGIDVVMPTIKYLVKN